MATVTITMVGIVYKKFPVVSSIMTANEIVILEDPASIAVAPSQAHVPSSTNLSAMEGYNAGFYAPI